MNIRVLGWSAIVLLYLAVGGQVASADVQYEYFEGNWTNVPNFSALGVPLDAGTLSIFRIPDAARVNNYAVRYTGTFTVNTAGTYSFATESDDGSRLWIDGALVVNNDGVHGRRIRTGTTSLTVGTHSIVVGYFDASAAHILNVLYSPPAATPVYRSYPPTGVLDHPETPAEHGSWGAVINWPHVPVSAANLPDGRVLTWAASELLSFPSSKGNEKTNWGVWDPDTNSVSQSLLLDHDMFCAHVVMLESGKVFVSGGRNMGQTPYTSVFDYRSNEWAELNNMNRGRWYPTSVALPDGSVFTAIGNGGLNTAESYSPTTGQWQMETGLNFNPMVLSYPDSQYGERQWFPLFQLGPDGRIFHAGPTPKMHWIDTSGSGSATQVGPEFTEWYAKDGAIVMYDVGKLVSAGGWIAGNDITSANEVMTIDISGAVPDVDIVQPMQNARKFHNGVMLPNGEVLIVGGNSAGEKFSDVGSVYVAEIWNPETHDWRNVAAMDVPRNYHSIALLLPDGRVLSAGGGLCDCEADHPNGQVYSPPYLFNPDGTPAVRPQITSAPAAIRPGEEFEVVTDTGISHFSMVKMSSTTHAMNTDLRYLSVDHDGAAGHYNLTSHENPNVLTPGYWMLFGLNAEGTPSPAAIVQVRRATAGEPDSVSVLNFLYANFADPSALQLNGNAQSTTTDIRLTSADNAAGSAYYKTPVQVGTQTSFSTRFQFSINGETNGNDGLTFTVQGNGAAELGGPGGSLGYEGTINSLSVEIDNADNGATDPDANHIAVNVDGAIDSPLASISAPFDLEDSNPHVMWVDYNGSSDLLEVFLAESASASKPTTPLLTVADVDLLSLVGARAYFGFTAGAGNAGNNHDIKGWNLQVFVGGSQLVVNPIEATPQSGDGPVTFAASASGVGLEYRWTFGDGSPETNWSTSPDSTHSYAQPGRYYVTLTVRDSLGNVETHDFVQAVHPPLTAESPKASSSLLVESTSGGERVWVVNPDNDSVTVVDPESASVVAEIAVGNDPRTLDIDSTNRVWVVNKKSSTVSIVDTAAQALVSTINLPPGSEPHGIVIDQAAGVAYVTLEGLGRLLKIAVQDGSILASLDLGSSPRHLSVSGSGSSVYVSRFITPRLDGEATTTVQLTGGAEVLQVSPSGTMNVTESITLGYNNAQPQEQTGPGFPNYLGPAVITPSGMSAWIASKQDNIPAGMARNGQPLTFEHSVRAVVSTFDIATNQEDLAKRIDLDDASVAANASFCPYGIYMFVPLEGNRQVSIVDVYAAQELARVDVGFAPQATAISADGKTLYVHNFMSRSIAIIDIADLMNGQSDTGTVSSTVVTVASEALSPTVFQGKRLFYDAADSRLALNSYMSCASCHNDGGDDGRVWDFTGFGEGLRNTINLVGHAGTGEGRLHWTANFDEVHDFENQIRAFSGGIGLMNNGDFAATAATLGSPKAGHSADLDALSAYVSSLDKFGKSPYRNADDTLTMQAITGKSLFEAANCDSCHSGQGFTDSALASELLHSVGTIKASSGQRMFGPLNGLDTPTLKGLWRTAPYLHDGSAGTVRQAVEAHDAGLLSISLDSQELDDLSAYLLQVDDLELGPSPIFQQESSGIVVMEAESFESNLPATTGANWSTVSEAGASSATALKSSNNAVTEPPDTAVLAYQVQFETPETYYILVRFRSFNSSSDSAYVQIDNLLAENLKLLPRSGAWEWTRSVGGYGLLPGQHTIKLLRREKLVEIDKVIVTPDAQYLPNGTGPLESPRTGGSGTTNQAPFVASIDDQTMFEGDEITIDVSATDNDGDNLLFSTSGLPAFGELTDFADGTGEIALAPQLGDEGTYVVEVFSDDDGSPSASHSTSFTLTVLSDGSSGFRQDPGGLLVIEAEHFAISSGSSDVDPWSVIGNSGASGASSLKSAPGGQTSPPDAPTTEYSAQFVVLGNHYVWLRYRSFNSGSDSVSVEIDDNGTENVKLQPSDGTWRWKRTEVPVAITPGLHAIKIWRREKLAEIDKIIVTPDAGYAPAAFGPPESPTF